MPKRLLITGGAGNLACQLTFALARRADEVVLFDLAERPVAAVAEGCRYVRGDVTSRDDLGKAVQAFRPDAIIHFASLLSGRSEEDRPLAWRVNMEGTFNLFEIALASGVRTVLFPSSVAAYGGKLPDPLPEDWPQWPEGLYGATKVACERLGVYYHAHHGIDFRCLRVPIVLSRYAPAGAVSAYASRAFVDCVQHGGFTFKVDPDTRAAMIYVKDVLRAFLMLLDAPAQHLTRRVYNIHALAPSAQELCDAIAARVLGSRLNFAPERDVIAFMESWPARIVDDSARRDWNWHPSYDLDRLADDFIAELRGEPRA